MHHLLECFVNNEQVILNKMLILEWNYDQVGMPRFLKNTRLKSIFFFLIFESIFF